MGITRKSAQTLAAIAALCLIVGGGVYIFAKDHLITKTWDEDPHGPVYLLPDGRNLLFTEGATESTSCFDGISFVLIERENAGSVAVHLHVSEIPDPPVAAGICADFRAYPLTLDRPLGARALTDSHARPLDLVDLRRAPQLHDPRLTAEEPQRPCRRTGALSPSGDLCGDGRAWQAFYNGLGRTWELIQEPTPGPVSTPADCTRWTDGAVLRWRQAGFALTLDAVPSNDPGAGPTDDRLPCDVLRQEAALVR